MFVRALILVACSMTPGVLMQAQSGPCTEDAIKQNKVTVADDVFMYMTPWGRPVIGKSTARDTSNKRFADHKNVQRSWVGAHGVVSSASADMAYEYGTMQMSYDSTADGKNHTFQAVMLEVYKAKEGACQLVAETMEPLEDGNAKSAAQTQPLPETPSSEIKKLGALVGQWKLEGAEVKPGSGMGAGDTVTGTASCEWAFGGLGVLCHENATTPGMGELRDIVVYGYDAKSKQYILTQVSNPGYIWKFRGNLDGDTWTFSGEQTGQGESYFVRFNVKWTSSDSFDFKNEVGPALDKMKVMMDGRQTRIKTVADGRPLRSDSPGQQTSGDVVAKASGSSR